MPPDDQMWMLRLEQLEQMLEHHIQQEEGWTFQVARQVVSENQATDIGQRFQQEKQGRMAA